MPPADAGLARVSRMMWQVDGCGDEDNDGFVHRIAMASAMDCDACLALLVATIRAEALEEAARVSDQWARSHSCSQHDADPCCHVRTGAAIADVIRALSPEENR